MRYITRDIDKEIVFFEGEEDKAREYFGVPEDCETLEEIADFWNAEHSGDAIGELKIY